MAFATLLDGFSYHASFSTSGNPLLTLVMLLVDVVLIAAMWRIFSKAGQHGWAAIIPIYNLVVLLRIAGRPAWWLLLMFIPFVNFVAGIMVVHGVSKAFGKGAGFTLGQIFLPFIFYPVLGFGSARYVGA